MASSEGTQGKPETRKRQAVTMAGIGNDSNGRSRITWYQAGRNRYVSVSSTKDTETIRGKVEAILSAASFNVPVDAEIVSWLTDLPDKLHGKLAADSGLVEAPA